MKRIFYFLLFLSFCNHISGQGYKEFWFVAPEVYQTHGDRPIYLRISTTTDTAHIVLNQPARSLFTPITATIAPNTVYTIDLTPWIDSIENKPGDVVLNYGLHLVSDVQVNAYYEEASSNNPELFTLKGKNALGTEFYINGQYHYPNHWVATTTCEAFDIVATEDNTQVTITVSQNIVGHAQNSTFTVTLNKGQTYSARCTSNAAAVSLRGSHVVANHPIAITISDDSIDEPAVSPSGWDLIGDQIIPVNLLGNEYIAVIGYDNANEERVYMEAIYDNTDIYLDGNPTPAATINKGQNFWSHYTNSTLYIKSSKPISAYQLTGFTNEAGSAILPQDSCTGSRQIGFCRTGSGTFCMMLLTRTGNEGSFTLDGSTVLITASDFSPVVGSSNVWMYARKSFSTAQVPVGNHIIANTTGKFHMGILNALGGSAEYGYYSDFSSLYLGPDSYLCHGDSVIIDAGPGMTSYTWEKLIGITWTVVGNQETYAVLDSGYYACVTSGEACTLSDTIHFGLYPKVTVSLGPDTTLCEGATVTFDPGPFVSYRWQNGFVGRYYTTGSAGLYWVQVTNNNGCKGLDTIIVAIDSLPKVAGSITGLSTVCQGQNGVAYSVQPFPFADTYSWTLPSGSTGASTTNAIIVDYSVVAVSDTLRVKGYNICGYGPELKLPITVNPLPSAAGAISGPGSVCPGQNGVVFSVPPITNALSYAWVLPAGASIVAGTGTNTITVDFTFGASSGIILVGGVNGCGEGITSSLPLNLYSPPVPVISGPGAVCLNTTQSYSTAAGMSNYQWSVSAGGNIISGGGTNTVSILWSTTGPKIITINYNDANGCAAASPSDYSVNVNTLPVPSLSGLTNVCRNIPILYTTDAGMINYIWSVSAGGTVTAGGTTSDNTITVSWNASGAQSVSVNYSAGIGCTAANPTILPVSVKPTPVMTNILNPSQCSGGTTTIVLQSNPPGSVFSWIASGSSPDVTGFSSSSGPTITQILLNSGFGVQTVTYIVTPVLNGCSGNPSDYVVTVFPVADVYFIPNGQSLCSGTLTGITLNSHVTGPTYSWSASGSSLNVSGYGPGNGSTITQTLTNTGTSLESVVYLVTPVANSCTGTQNSVSVTVYPLPAVTFTLCNDPVTTTSAVPFRLKGGIPSGGSYTGAGVSAGTFFPSLAGTGSHILTYSASNTWGCSSSATQTFQVINAPAFLCDNLFTDPRDNKQYPTVKLGAQCWMATNLVYGTTISFGQIPRDNCIPEKKCFNDLPANCTTSGGLYTWDELMQYDESAAGQGLCPPGWHVPTENEWTTLFNFYLNNGFAGSPLKYTGYSGFNALLDGDWFKYSNWAFYNFATMIWSSSSDGPDKAWAHGMNEKNPSVSYYPAVRSNAFSARCIKD